MIKAQTDRKYAISVSLTVAIFTLVEKGQRVIRNPQIGKRKTTGVRFSLYKIMDSRFLRSHRKRKIFTKIPKILVQRTGNVEL